MFASSCSLSELFFPETCSLPALPTLFCAILASRRDRAAREAGRTAFNFPLPGEASGALVEHTPLTRVLALC